MSSRRFAPGAPVFLWLVLLTVPFVVPNNYYLSLAIFWLIYLILLNSLNLVMGYAGQISLGHAAFFGLGAYTSGVLSTKFALSPWIGLVAAVVLTSLAALLIGIPALRLRGHYLSMATLGFGACMSVFFVQLHGLTGGPNGLIGVPSLDIAGFSLGTDRRFFYFAWAVTGLVLLLTANLLNARFGRGLRALASSEIAAAAMGIDVFRRKLQVFVISAAMAAVAGFLYVHYINFASPETFDFAASVMLLVTVALGGSGRFAGAFYGALLYISLPALLEAYPDWEVLFWGVSLCVVLIFMPGGIAGGMAGLLARLR
jgi:branched-chain amino acid transport system permease protein